MSRNEATRTGALGVRERHTPSVPALVHEPWEADFPWLVQGTTTRGAPPLEFDLGLFSEGSPAERVRQHWSRLLEATGMRAAVHARQVHGANVRLHDAPTAGLNVVGECDGHVTSQAGVLLAVTIADCVPVFVVEPTTRTVGVLHAGWRGAAAGVVEHGLEAVRGDSRIEELHVHLGPAICGRCYEVGPEVFVALGEPAPPAKSLLDVRDVLVRRVLQAGVRAPQLTVSDHCTRCTASGLFSHRGGDRGRQVGYLGIRV